MRKKEVCFWLEQMKDPNKINVETLQKKGEIQSNIIKTLEEPEIELKETVTELQE